MSVSAVVTALIEKKAWTSATSAEDWRAIGLYFAGAIVVASAAEDPDQLTGDYNKVEEYKYDSNGRMTQIKDKRGNVVVTNTYDTNGRVIQQDYPGPAVVTYAYTTDAGGNITQTDMTDARSLVTRMQFNTARLMTNRIEAFGTALARTSAFEYRPADNLLSATVAHSDQFMTVLWCHLRHKLVN